MSTTHTSSRSRIAWPSHVLWLWLLVIFVGIQFGAGLYEKLVVVPLWANAPAEAVVEQIRVSGMYAAGRAFWPFVSPPVAVLAVVNLILAWRHVGAARDWWLAGSALMCAYALASYGYFVPQMLMLQSAGDTWPAARIESLVDWWTGMNYLRMAIGAAGWLCLLRALSLSALSGRGQPADHVADVARRSPGTADGETRPSGP